MGVYEGQGNLAKAMKDLMIKWAEAKGSWDDVNAHRLEADFLIPLEKDLRSALGAMDQMGQLLFQIRRDCE